MVKVNLAGQEIREFEAPPPGQYRLVVDQGEERTAESSGEANIFWLLKITQPLKVRGDVEDLDSLIGRTVMHGCSLQDQALWNLYRTLVAFGEDPAALQAGEVEIIPETYVGRECVATIRHRVWEGETRAQVVNMRPLTEEEAAQLV